MIFADTHVLVWLFLGDPRLPSRARGALFEEKALAISAVTAWEYADLQARGRLPYGLSLDELLSGMSLKVEPFPADCWRIARQLPPIHGDPLDRMLIAHTIAADAVLATGDAHMRRYPVKLLW